MPKAPAKPITVLFGGIDIPVWTGDSKHPLIPKLEADIWYPAEHYQAIATAVKENIACLLVGETGTGKTSILREVAYLRQQPYVRINLTGYTSPDELIGSKSAQNGSTYFEEGAMVKAMRDGALLVMDEINATPPDCLFALHSLLDDERKVTLPTGTVVYPHPDFRFFATMNPDYEGTKSVNKALTDRFGIILNVEHLEPDKEIEYLVKHSVKKEDAEIMVMFATKARKSYQERQTSMFVSTRTLLQWGALIATGLTVDNAFVISVLNKLPHDADMRRGISDIYHSVIKKNPQTKNNEFGIYKVSDYEQMMKSIKTLQNELKQKESQWLVQKADLIQKVGKAADLIKAERAKYQSFEKLLPQIKALANQPEAQELVEAAPTESEFAGTHLDIRKPEAEESVPL